MREENGGKLPATAAACEAGGCEAGAEKQENTKLEHAKQEHGFKVLRQQSMRSRSMRLLANDFSSYLVFLSPIDDKRHCYDLVSQVPN